ncbi:universal stress protein [Pseudonocardia sp.]|uniref:universal stress protein n=1 Tax=Pseudonocardia sp. TaxID=60912 RepID=UPI003D13E046
MQTATVVVGVDGSEAASEAVRWAAGEAARRGAVLRLVAVCEWPRPGFAAYDGLGHDVAVSPLATTRAAVDAAADLARATDADVRIETSVRSGFALPCLLKESRRTGLVVVGGRGCGGAPGMRVGSVAYGLAARADCPVVVVHGRAQQPDTRPVVVGVDGSAVSDAALEFAFDAAAARGVPLVAVHVRWDMALPSSTLPAGMDRQEAEAHGREVLASCVARWSAKYPDVPVEQVVRSDLPAQALLERASGAQMVVVGSHGRGPVRRALLGSVSHALVHQAPCPVAVVRWPR